MRHTLKIFGAASPTSGAGVEGSLRLPWMTGVGALSRCRGHGLPRQPLSRLANSRRAYVFGVVRVATLALLTFTTLSGLRSSGVVTTRFSGHAVTFRSSPTVCADTPRFLSASTLIWQAAKGDVECGSAFGLISHKGLPYCRYHPSTFLPGGRRAGGPTHVWLCRIRMSALPSTATELMRLRET